MRNHFSHPFLRVNQPVSGNGDCSTMRQKALILCSEFWEVYKVAGNGRNKEECYGGGH